MVTASYGHYGQRAARIGPDRIIMQIRLSAYNSVLFFQRRRGPCFAKPFRIRSEWRLVQKQLSQCAKIIGPGFWQDATGPPPVSLLLDSVVFLHRRPGSYCAKPAGSDLFLADCVRFGPNRSGPEASRCARITQPASGQHFRAEPNRMRIGSRTFAGLIVGTKQVQPA